jgi:TonB family protein
VQLGPDVQDVTVIAKAPLKLGMGARFRRVKGTAIVDVLIGINGVPDEVRMVKRSGNEKIDKAALEAAQNSRFLPAMKDGVRVRLWKRMEFGNED